MPSYQYVALNPQGKKIRGRLVAANEIDLEARLQTINLDVVDVKMVRESKPGFLSGRVGLQDLIIFCLHVEQLERAGVPILDAVADMRDTADNPQMKNIMADVYESIRSGDVLSQALAKHPKVFDNIFVGLVAAGEKTGNLQEVFRHLGNHLKWISYIRKRVRKATTYPAFLLILMFGVMSLMMMFVIPKLSGFLTAQNFDLPLYTKALIAFSDFFSNYWYLILLFPFTAYLIIKISIKHSDNARIIWDQFKLGMPVIGKTLRKIELARFCHFFSILYSSGIGILECLEVASNVVGNRVIQLSILQVRDSVAAGSSLTNAVKITGQFPSLVIRMFKIGEESGNLEVGMDNINFFYDKEVEDSVNNMVGFIQPALTMVMGGLMLWVSMAVFGPLYNSFSTMKF